MSSVLRLLFSFFYLDGNSNIVLDNFLISDSSVNRSMYLSHVLECILHARRSNLANALTNVVSLLSIFGSLWIDKLMNI